MRTQEAPIPNPLTTRRGRALLSACGSALMLTCAATTQFAAARTIEHNTAPAIRTAEDRGPAAASETMTVTLWLQAPNADAAAEQLVGQLYDPKSRSFHRWLTDAEATAALAPSAAQLRLVQRFLTDHHLRTVAVDEGRLYIRASGSVADVQKAMHVSIHKFGRDGEVFRANTSDPTIEEPAGAFVASVGGLSEHHMQPHSMRTVDPETGKPFPAAPLASMPNGAFFSAQCFREPEHVSFTTNGGLPTASYRGNRYGADITNTAFGTLAPCGYQPSDLQSAYGFNQLYAVGLDGSGETVVIVDAIGSPTIAADAEVFSQVYGLPDLTPANFQVYFPGGQPPAPDSGWATETSLDVEWAHSVAPHANIALVIAPTSNDSDLEAAVLFAVRHHLGHVISNSYGEAESDAPVAASLNAFNHINRLAAARGISVNFSSGDGGDSNPSGFTPGLILPGVSTPADSPWATAVGGTSLAINSKGELAFQTAWGNNITRIADTIALGSPPVVPPLLLGFQGGSGGGTSGFFGKPEFQQGLAGNGRLVPDISFVADPFTGAEFICDGGSCFDAPGTGPQFSVVGGTSLSCPIFSALWAIANQGAGSRLGQAARMLYTLPAGAITDIVAVSSEDNARGSITHSTGVTRESASDLAQPLENTRRFYSALYNSLFSTRWFVLTFGTDSSLTAGQGWDNATGLGTPNGKAFVDAVVAAATHQDD
jgi:subtilase family serine protease